MAEKTPWFAPGTKPSRVGLYESFASLKVEPIRLRHGDGRVWRSEAGIEMMCQRRYWRGLASKP